MKLEMDRAPMGWNSCEEEQAIACDLSEVRQAAQSERPVRIARELWTEAELRLDGVELADTVPPHGARLFQLL